MYKLNYPADNYDEAKIDKALVLALIRTHYSKVARQLRKNKQYYDGKHKILIRKKSDPDAPNNTVVCNHAKDITDTATGYFMASALTFKCSDESMDIDKLTDAFDTGNVDEVDHDNALDMSIEGCAYEYVYIKKGANVLLSKNLSSLTTFIVYDDTIEENELFAIYYDRIKDDSTRKYAYVAHILTEHYIYKMTLYGDLKRDDATEPLPHGLGEIPIILHQNNKDCIGDFEQQIKLIDAYNTLMSDRINDKEQFLNSLLVLYGARLADDAVDTESVNEISKALKVLRDHGFLELPEGSKAEYITRTLDEVGVEVLRKAIKEDIYNFSHVPNMSDENFAGNTSGVAMEYKLLALEDITRTKERYYTKGLKKRIRLYCHYLNLMSVAVNPSAIMPTFKRALPKNLLELSQIIGNLKGMVSKSTLIQQLPFVEDPEGEITAVDEENKKAMKDQQAMFNVQGNTPPQDEDEDKAKKSTAIANSKADKQGASKTDQ